jgi:hypothetical protein
MAATIETRRRQHDPLAHKFKDDNERRRYFATIAAKGNRERLTFGGDDVARIAESAQTLAQHSSRFGQCPDDLAPAYAFLQEIGRRARAKHDRAAQLDQEAEDVT